MNYGEAIGVKDLRQRFGKVNSKQTHISFWQHSLTRRSARWKAEKIFLLLLSCLALNFASLIFTPIEVSVASDISASTSKETMWRNADNLFAEGVQKYRSENFEAALQAWSEALSLYRKLNNHKGETETIRSLESLITLLKQSLNLYRKQNNIEKEVEAIRNIIDVYFRMRRFKEAEQFIKTSIAEFRESEREIKSELLVKALHDYLEKRWRFAAGFGVVADQGLRQLYAEGKLSWQEVIDVSSFNLVVARYVGNRLAEVNALHGIGWAYRNLGRFDEAINYYERAMEVSKVENDDPSVAFLYVEIGIAYLDIGLYSKSLEKFQKSLDVSSNVNDDVNQPVMRQKLQLKGFALTRIGMAYIRLKQYDAAFKALQKARNLDFLFEGHITLLGIGFVYYQKRDFTRALGMYQKALYRITVGDPSAKGEILNRIGLLYVEQQNYPQALETFREALVTLKTLNNSPGEASTLSHIATLFERQNQLELAIAFYKQSVNLTETIRQNLRRLTLEEQKAYAESVAGTYRALADLLIQQGRLSEAQAVLELLKLSELREFTRDAGIQSSGISLAKVEEAALKQILEQFTTVGNFTQKLAQCQQTNCSNLRQLEQQRDTLDIAIRQELNQQRAILAKHFSTEASTLTPEKLNAEARRIVNAQPGTVLIYPLVLKNKIQFLVAFQAGNGAVTFRPFETQVSAEQLFKTIQTFRQQLGETTNRGTPKADLKTVQATSQQLYTWLIKPLEAELKNSAIEHLVFAPDSTTRYIPLAALYDGQQYLIQRFTVSTITAASQTDTTTRTPKPTDQTPLLLAMGASQFPNLNPLTYVPAELDAITKTNTSSDRQGIYPGSKYLDRTFDYEALQTSLKKGTYRILHLATHGAFKPGRVEDSYLVLGHGRNLTTELIDQLGNYGLGNIHLVVLSACETAVGDRASDGIEIPGISYFFLKNEVKSVVASLWNVNDVSTALMMQQFYKHLADGMTKAEALKTVQQDFIRSTLTAKDAPARSDILVTVAPGVRTLQNSAATFSHPYYWAPFILIGNSL